MTPKVSCLIASILCFTMAEWGIPQTPPSAGGESRVMAPLNWGSSARWRHGLKKTSGTVSIADSGIDFQAANGFQLRWQFQDVQTFDLSPRHLTVTGYENRRWDLPGERRFSFDLASAVPPAVADALSERIAKPAVNGVPDPKAPAFAALGARHQTRGGGTNGVLRFRKSGIDYVTRSGRGARDWRWADIQTLAFPDAYHFRIGGFREIFEFELKEPMSNELFDRLWNDVYARDFSGVKQKGEVQ